LPNIRKTGRSGREEILIRIGEPRGQDIMCRYSGQVQVYEFQYYLRDSRQAPRPPYRENTTGLVKLAADGGIHVIAGTSTGSIQLTIELHSMPPATVDWEDWEEIVEVSYHTAVGDTQARGSCGLAPDPGLPVLSFLGPGNYRIRVHALGRDDPRNQNPFTTVERHHLAVWPGPMAKTVIHQATDEFGRCWRAALARARTRHAESGRMGTPTIVT
jgi:hypothetical protein